MAGNPAVWEQVLIGAILAEPEAIVVASGVRSGDFEYHNHELIWSAVAELGVAGGITSGNVIAKLREKGQLNSIGDEDDKGIAYINRIAAPNMKGVPLAAEEVKNAGMLKDLRGLSGMIHTMSLGGKSANELMDSMMDKMTKIRRDKFSSHKIGEILPSYKARIESIRRGDWNGVWQPAMPPIREHFVSAVEPSEFIIIGAGTGGGKSSYMRYEAMNAAAKGSTVLTYDGEDDINWYVSYAIAYISGVDTFLLRNPEKMSNAQMDKYLSAVDKVAALPWYRHVLTPGGWNEIMYEAQRLKQTDELALLQINGIPNLATVQSFEAYETAAYAIRNIATNVEVPIMAAHQLRRGDNVKRKPSKSDLVYAGERAAKNIWLVYEEQMTDAEAALFPANLNGGVLVPPENRRVVPVRFNIDKQSSGPTGITTEIAWHKHLNRYLPLPADWRTSGVTS